MEDLKRFVTWLEKYLAEGHDIVCTSAVIHELKKVLSSLEEGKKED